MGDVIVGVIVGVALSVVGAVLLHTDNRNEMYSKCAEELRIHPDACKYGIVGIEQKLYNEDYEIVQQYLNENEVNLPATNYDVE